MIPTRSGLGLRSISVDGASHDPVGGANSKQGRRRLSKSGWAISPHSFWSIPIPTPIKNRKCFENL